MSFLRDEDRDILIELKMKGTSPKTFAALSKRLKKSTEQVCFTIVYKCIHFEYKYEVS